MNLCERDKPGEAGNCRRTYRCVHLDDVVSFETLVRRFLTVTTLTVYWGATADAQLRRPYAVRLSFHVDLVCSIPNEDLTVKRTEGVHM